MITQIGKHTIITFITFSFIVFILRLYSSASDSYGSDLGADKIQMVVGQDIMIKVYSVKAVSIGLPIAKIDVRPKSSEILITAISSGKSTMTIWDELGRQTVKTLIILDYDVNDIKELVKDIRTSVTVIGSKIVLKGQLKSLTDKEKIQNVLRAYEKLIDQTQFKPDNSPDNSDESGISIPQPLPIPNISEIENLIGLPNVKIKIPSDSIAKVVFLDGTVASEYEQNRAVRIAENYFEKVVNLLKIEPAEDPFNPLNSKLIEMVKSKGAELEVDQDLFILKGELPNSNAIAELQKLVSESSSKKIVNALQRSKKMVEVDVTIIEISSNKTKELQPLKFGFNSGLSIAGTGTGDLSPISSKKADINYSASIDLLSQLRWMVSKGYARIVSKPKVITMSGEKARFLVGGSIPIRLYDAYGSSKVDWKEHGIRLMMEPSLDQDGVMISKVEVEISSLDWTNQVDGIPALSTRSVETNISLKQSQSAIIAGLTQKNRAEKLSRTPILGYIPLLNLLFSSKNAKEEESELAIIITPRSPTSSLEQYEKINFNE